ncbi:hypothetical protein CC1G_11681 [Coprinopsis cinerea okayama7|uniref:CxC2-like cysteine cluster KDZ transposase-associated domain-containing protein n=1 Tax=Coprinopsis cinerea (strain Okayama-7 / 130 / ATCC MYA-4618 / FGSC 9003) TaxID=240176 RepID=A8P3U7_COPC7|nr:hypothetical protein CC1G_11681 [Coprinopsis cinerea okayama7\|eukprot:XP_001838619.2 hypothetical protein CC1G_11681 [Coprinopsis cinerea okayama7\
MTAEVTATKTRKKIKLVPVGPSPKKTSLSPEKIKAYSSPMRSPYHASVSGAFDNDPDEEWEYIETGNDGGRATLNSNTSKSSNDYMLEWKLKQYLYLDEVIGREASGKAMACQTCGGTRSGSWWRCQDCVGSPLYCRECCYQEHLNHPFHRVQTWNGEFFTPDWLWRCGIGVNLCPNRKCEPIEDDDDEDDRDFQDKGQTEWDLGDDLNFNAKPKGRILGGCKVLVVVHSNGVHYLPFHFCHCMDAVESDIQLLRQGFYPSTSQDVRTVFTFTLLDDYLLQTLECATSSHHYYSKLRRLTNEPFPGTVPDRTRELRRVGRQWRRLKELKRHGFGHLDRTPGNGDLALFCAACPQPGINLPPNWQDDPEQWKYTRSFVADGNFTCVHRKRANQGEVYLKNGEGFMTEKDRYQKHLKIAKETTETPTCHEHRAIADKGKVHKGCDATGIGAIACMRHGAFCPGSVVDFQKGERQINMDYALAQSVTLTVADETKRIILAYDINCQYSKKALDRLGQGRYTRIRTDLVWVWGIGLFHVHGHQESCNARYSLTYIRGAGCSSGEILESLWAQVNEVARATSTMSLPHRAEVLDAILNDSNWKKLINLVPSISKNWRNSRLQLIRAEEDFQLLNESASESQVALWQAQLDQAHENRTRDVSVMDILNADVVKPPTLAKVRTTLMEKERSTNRGLGVTSWLHNGMRIQESQINLKAHMASLPKERSDAQELEVAKKREQLQKDINDFYATASTLFPDADFDALRGAEESTTIVQLHGEAEVEDIEDDEDNPFSMTHNEVENVKIPLPSSFDSTPPSMERARGKELRLRIGQAEDALESVRTEIGHKSFLYRSNIRLAEGKQQKTRGYASVKAVNNDLRRYIKIYHQARWALTRLGADADTLARYRQIKTEDTKAITAIYSPNARGQRNVSLSWIWTLNVQGDSMKSEYLEELYRVNWLRAKSRAERWEEEHTLLTYEMDWVVRFFAYKQDQCRQWAAMKPESPGHNAYAMRQSEMWRLMCMNAQKAFLKTRQSVLNPVL